MPEEMKCAKCGSDLLVRLGNEMHCNACGHSFDLDRSPIATAAQASKAARSPKSGWHKHGRDG
jgi:hypothetical protein